MITGHFGLAAGVKKIAPRLPLWSLLLATFWLDVIFTVLSMFGLEDFTPMNPTYPVYGEVIIHAPYTHSLLGAVLISLATGWLAGLRWKRAGGTVIGAVVFSHWILDLLVHRTDLPILFGNLGNLPLLGLGLWDYPVISGGIEVILATGGAYLYHRGAMDLDKKQHRLSLTASVVTGALIFSLLVTSLLGL